MHGLESCFITLTYRDECLPPNGSLSLRDLQLFFKRLRKKLSGGVRFLACGEYGDTLYRPHYHALLFGHRPNDLVKFFVKNGMTTYLSASLEKVWQLGFVTVSEVTLASAAYVAQYVLKKNEHTKLLEKLDKETGEVVPVTPPFITMSKNPGLGAKWFERYGMTDIYPRDECVLNGRHFKVPRYYDQKLKKQDEQLFDRVKKARQQRAAENPNFDADRRAAKERIAKARLKNRKPRDANHYKAV